MEMVFNLFFMHNVYVTVISNSFNGLNNKCASNMKSASRERRRVGF